jgi:hypothetical protein
MAEIKVKISAEIEHIENVLAELNPTASAFLGACSGVSERL